MAERRLPRYRAWDKTKKKMFSVEQMGADELSLHPNGKGFFNPHSVSPILSQYYPHLLPLQYIGVEDRLGREICEGDLLKEEMPKTYLENSKEGTPKIRYYICEWRDNGFYLRSQHKYPWHENKFWNHIQADCEIIGNIYENPEKVL